MYFNLLKLVFFLNIDLLFWILLFWVLLVFFVLLFVILVNYIKEKLDIRWYEKDKRLFMNMLVEIMIKRYDKNVIYNGFCLILYK